MKNAIFLDRDGTLNYDTGYTYKREHFKLIEGALEALQLLKSDFLFFIVTNQSGVGRGYYTLADVCRYNELLLAEFKKSGIAIQNIYICPHTDAAGCDCRKPQPKFILQAAREFKIDIAKSWMIGDHPWDVQCGHNAGCKAIYVLSGHGEKHRHELAEQNIKPDYIAQNILDAAEFIMKHVKRKN